MATLATYWEHPVPQRMATTECTGSTGGACIVQQDALTPGACMLSIGPSRAAAAAAAAAGDRRVFSGSAEGHPRVHVKSDIAMHPHCGIFYFEVEIRSIAAGGERGGGGPEGAAVGPSRLASEPAIVVGICRKSLPAHRLPGEERSSIGFFAAQRMIYADSASDGESVGARKANRVGDVVGCLVNFIEGTVRFTMNGELLRPAPPLSRRLPWYGYYAAVGVQRLQPSLSLRIQFLTAAPSPRAGAPLRQPVPPPAGGGDGQLPPRPHAAPSDSGRSPVRARAATPFRSSCPASFVFNYDAYCNTVAEGLITQVGSASRAGDGPESGLAGEAADGPGSRSGGAAGLDARMVAAIRQHLAARGMAKALAAFDREQAELRTGSAAGADDGGERPAEAEHHEMEDPGPSNGTASRPHSRRGSTAVGYNSAHCQLMHELRAMVLGGNFSGALQHVATSSVLAAVPRCALGDCVAGVAALPPKFWGLMFLARRQDMLYLLKALALVESALACMERMIRRHLAGGRRREDDPACTVLAAARAELLEPLGDVAVAAWRAAQHARGGAAPQADRHPLDDHGALRDESAAMAFLRDRCGAVPPCASPQGMSASLIRESVPVSPAPRASARRRVVQILGMLMSHLRACLRDDAGHGGDAAATGDAAYLHDWLLMIDSARAQYRAHGWRRLLHALEDFNGSVEYHLTYVTQLAAALLGPDEGRERCGGGLQPYAAKCLGVVDGTAGPWEGAAYDAGAADVGSWRLLTSLRAMWRHVHTVATLEPLLHVASHAFCERLRESPPSAAASRISAYARKRRPLPSWRLDAEPPATDPSGGSGGGDADGGNHRPGADAVDDDVQLSLLYLKRLHAEVFQ